MKVTSEHLTMLESAITPLNTEAAREGYRAGRFPRSELCRDLNLRYRWDLLWAAKHATPELVAPVLSANYKNSHLDTALRSIVPDITSN